MTIEQFIQQMRSLNQLGLYTSAEFMGNFILTSKATNGSTNTEAITTYADALFGKKEYARAAHYYRKALQIIQSVSSLKKPIVNAPKTKSSSDEEVNGLKFKIAQCYLKQNDFKTAVSILEGIHPNERTIAVNIIMAKHYRQSGNDSAAITSYKSILKENPFAIEATMALIELNASIDTQTNQKSLYSEWADQAISIHQQQTKHDYKGALPRWVAMDTSFTNNVYILHNIAKCEIQANQPEKAKGTFERIRMVDPYFMDSMDTYASIVKTLGTPVELNKLSQQLVTINPKRAEPWAAIAMYSELKGKKQEALASIERALELNDRHVIAHLLKGNLLLTSDHPDEAIHSFKRAYNLNRDILAFAGLVRSYLGVSKLKEALTFASEANKIMPGNPQALALLGLVLSQPVDASYRKRARQKFEEALKIDKFCLDAILGLSQLHVAEGRFGDAVDMLKEQLKHNNKDFLHARLAEVLVLATKNTEALEHYNIALRLNPNSELAKKGLERLEKIIKGEDPDHEEQEEEEDEEYVQEDDEDEELVE